MQTHQRGTSQQSVDQRMDSAQDVSRGAPRYGIPRSALVGFVSALPVIHSLPPSETAVSLSKPHASAFLLLLCAGTPWQLFVRSF